MADKIRIILRALLIRIMMLEALLARIMIRIMMSGSTAG